MIDNHLGRSSVGALSNALVGTQEAKVGPAHSSSFIFFGFWRCSSGYAVMFVTHVPFFHEVALQPPFGPGRGLAQTGEGGVVLVGGGEGGVGGMNLHMV